jgi:eukaryotic-like serine/threonine-protein kinase
MRITEGTRLGPYEIIAPLGAGGMGEVYRARDTRLDRAVAIKVLPDALAGDPQFRERFEREARTTSHLNHPHICAVYDVGDFKPAGAGHSVGFLVMEYLEGETLAARLERGPLPLDHVLRLGVQIATALDKAHRAGITHRDLKPANVMLTKSGSASSVPQAKLLDFGLAKKTAAAVTIDAATMQGTREAPLTQQGTILGTFQYMAPEQLEGQDADARTDIFAFGALLYEMTTGKKAFEARNKTSLIAAIVSGQPAPVSVVQPLTPPALEHVIRKCLEKDPDDRWQSAHDIAEELRWVGELGSQAGVAVPTNARRNTRDRIAWAIAALALIALAGIAALTLRDRREPTAYAFTIPRADHGFEQASVVSVSPDGKWLCFPARPGEGRPSQLYVRGIESFDSKPLAGTEQAAGMCHWGLDSQSVAFYAAGKLRAIDTASAATRDVLETEDIYGVAMNRDGDILIGSSLTGLRRLSRDGTAQIITTPDKARHELVHGYPVFLPDGRRFLYISGGRDPSTRAYPPHYLYAGSLDSQESTFLGEIPSRVKYVEPGYLVFVRDGTLMYIRFDAESLTMSGEPARLADGVRYFKPTGDGEFSASFNGVVTYRAPVGGQSLSWVDTSGRRVGTIGPASAFGVVRFSADGSEVVSDVVDLKIGTPDLWMFGTRRQTATRLTSGSGYESDPVITRDGKSLFYSGDALGVPDIFVKQLGSADEDKPFWVNPGEQYASDVSPDGKVVLLRSNDYQSGTGIDIYTAPADGSAAPTPFVKTPFTENNARFSPDGQTVAYQSNETGANQIYTKPFPGPGRARQLSTARGALPRWSADGKQLYFRRANSMFVVDMTAADAEPRLLFDTDRPFSTFEVAPDGQRFLMIMNEEAAEQVPTRVIVNWPAMIGPKR